MVLRSSLPLTVVAALLIGGRAAAADLAQVREARSLAAEAAAVERLAAAGALPDIYARQMRQEAREQLVKASRRADRDAPRLAAPLARAVRALDAHDAAGLQAVAQALFAMEGAHGRAD